MISQVAYAEYITDARYDSLAAKFHQYELVNENDSIVRVQIMDLNALQSLMNFTQVHEYTISQDDNNPTYIQKILIIVKDNIYFSMPSYIIRYAHDIHNAFGCAVDIVSVNGETAPQIRSLIQTYATNLNGVVMIGNVIPAFYSNDNISVGGIDWGRDTYPCDLFYMDIDGVWQLKNPSGGIYDDHTGNVEPEIFLGRINTAYMGGNEIVELKCYLDKDHQYWTGAKTLNKQRALTFTEKDWDESAFWHSVSPLYGNNYYDVVKANMFIKSDYLNYLQNSNYEFIQLACHSHERAHKFILSDVISYVRSDDIAALNTKQIGYNLFCCHACNWTFSSYLPCLGECYLYGQEGNSSALAIVGSTKSGSMLGFSDFYTPLGNGMCIGQALKLWWKNHPGSSHSTHEKLWFYGMTILGDPLIDFNFTNDCDEILVLNNGEETSNNIYYAQNKIILQNYSITQGQSVTLSAPSIQITGPFVCNTSSSFTTRVNDSCVCNTLPYSKAPKRYTYSGYKQENSIDNCQRASSISIYPNPVREKLTISCPVAIERISIYTLSGECVLQTTIPEINVSVLPAGLYLIRIFTIEGQSYQSKIIHI